MPRAGQPDPRHGLLGAAAGGGQSGEEPAAELAADEPGVAPGRAGGSWSAGAGTRPQDRGQGNVRADRSLNGAGSATRGEISVERRSAEPGQRQRGTNGGAAGGENGRHGQGVWLGRDSGEDCAMEVGEEVNPDEFFDPKRSF